MTLAAVKKTGDNEFEDFGYADYPQLPAIEPERWNVDPISALQAIYYGIEAVATDDKKPDLEDVIWVLLVEAARTERAILPPRPAGYFSAFPEVYHTSAEIKGVENQWAHDGITYSPEIKPRATAAEMQRHEAVTLWLAYVRGRDRAQSKRIVWQLAQGRSPEALAKLEGYGTARGIRAKRDKELVNIAKRLKEQLEVLRRFFS